MNRMNLSGADTPGKLRALQSRLCDFYLCWYPVILELQVTAQAIPGQF